MIDHLYSQFHKHSNIGIACLYVDYKDQTNQSLVHILGSLLRQFLTNTLEPISDEVMQKLYHIRYRGGKVGTEDNIGLLKIQLQRLKCVFICIDAIDELEPKVQRQLLDVLKELGTDNTSLFFTGRDHIEIEVKKRFHVMPKYRVVISASQQDIQEFVVQKIKEDRNPDAMDKVLEQDIVHAIIKKSQGM